MRVFWRKLCGLALGVVLLPSLAGGGACLEHAAHAKHASVTSEAHDAHAGVASGPRAGVASEANAGVASEAHAEHAASVSPQLSELHATRESGAMPAVGASNDQPALIASVTDAPGSNCCAPSGSAEHCAGAAGCSVSAMLVAASDAPHVGVASQVSHATGALAPPGPTRAPDVPPPRA